jgi:hypothetical protein
MLTSRFKKRNRKTLKGGMKVTPEYDLQTAAIFYLKNCTFKVLSTSGYSCTTFICDFKLEPTRSPYRGLSRSGTFGNPITTILLKLSYHAPEDLPVESSKVQHGDKLFKHIKTSEIQHEVHMQHVIYLKSLLQNKCFIPICPSVLFCQSEPFNDKSSDLFIDLVKSELVTEEKNRARDLAILKNYRQNRLIFTMMECLPNAKTMSEVLQGVDISALARRVGLEPNPKTDEASKMLLEYSKNLLYGLTRMHRLGFAHRDFHMLNALLVPSYANFGNTPCVHIIDFGQTVVMTDEQREACSANRVACLEIEHLDQYAYPRAFFLGNTDEQVERLFSQKDAEFITECEDTKRVMLEHYEEVNQFIGYDITSTFEMPNEEFNQIFFQHCKGRIAVSALLRSSISSERFSHDFDEFEEL